VIVLWLLVAHLVGDFLLQTRWQATGKFGWSWEAVSYRANHVVAYTFCFLPIAWHYGVGWGASWFLLLLAALHFLTDAQRFTSTPGDVVRWKLWRLQGRTDLVADAWTRYLYAGEEAALRAVGTFPYEEVLAWRLEKARGITGETLRWPPPNPWPSLPLAIDQTLHLVQLAVLADLFLPT
jgi:hypothetical protein